MIESLLKRNKPKRFPKFFTLQQIGRYIFVLNKDNTIQLNWEILLQLKKKMCHALLFLFSIPNTVINLIASPNTVKGTKRKTKTYKRGGPILES